VSLNQPTLSLSTSPRCSWFPESFSKRNFMVFQHRLLRGPSNTAQLHFSASQHGVCNATPPWMQPRGNSMVSLINSHTNATRSRWHLWEIDSRFAPGLPPGWIASSYLEYLRKFGGSVKSPFSPLTRSDPIERPPVGGGVDSARTATRPPLAHAAPLFPTSLSASIAPRCVEMRPPERKVGPSRCVCPKMQSASRTHDARCSYCATASQSACLTE